MKPKENFKYWSNRKSSSVNNLLATTNSQIIKKIEISSIVECLKEYKPNFKSLLEIGCGTGINLEQLSRKFSESKFYGFDFVPDMIYEAKKMNLHNIEFDVGNLREPKSWIKSPKEFDVILSVRCLINLANETEQFYAIENLTKRLKKNGILILVENFKNLRDSQNKLRKLVNKPPRELPNFNFFLKYNFLNKISSGKELELLCEFEHAPLHDFVVYLLGENDFNQPNYNSRDAEIASLIDIERLKNGLKTNLNLGQAKTLVFKKK